MTYTVTFGRYEPLAGFAGYVDNNQVAALGFFKYMCAERPEDLDNGVIDNGDTTDPTESGTGEQNGSGTVTETGTDTGSGADSGSETDNGSAASTGDGDGNTDSNGNQSSSGEGSVDDALDPTQTREN